MPSYLQFLFKDSTCNPGVDVSFKLQVREHIVHLCKTGISDAEQLVVMTNPCVLSFRVQLSLF